MRAARRGRHLGLRRRLRWIHGSGVDLPAEARLAAVVLGLFDMYAGPWSRRFDDSTFVKLLISYLPVTGVTALAAW
jgi:hypothetical protein